MTEPLERELKAMTEPASWMEPYEYIEWARIHVKASHLLDEKPRPGSRELAATPLPWEDKAPPESEY